MLLILGTLAYCLAATIVLELLFALICGLRNREDLKLIVLVNCVTNPPVAFIYGFFFSLDTYWWAELLMLELAAVTIEALYYKRYALTIKRYWLFSLGANAFSYTVGHIISML